MLSETLIISIILASSALVSYAIRLMFVSKCDVCKLCCGFIEVHRNTNQELQNISNRNFNNLPNPATNQVIDIENK